MSVSYLDVVIYSGLSLSTVANLDGFTLTEIQMPDAWTTANLTFQTSFDNVTYQNAYDDLSTEKTVQAAASRNLRVSPSVWSAIQYLKIRSGTSGSAVNQNGDREIRLILWEGW